MSAAYTNETDASDAFASARGQFEAMERHLGSPTAMQARHSDLEEYARQEGRELQRLLIQAHYALRGAQEVRLVEVRGADGVRRRKLRASFRALVTIFGVVDVPRLAYQAEGVAGLHPMDAALNLPRELYSHCVRRNVAEHAARESYDAVVHEMRDLIGTPLGKRQIEQLAIRAACDFETFYAVHTVEVEDTYDLLVLSFDGAGLIMKHEDLRPATQKAAAKAARQHRESRSRRREKRNRKRMAEVAAIYTIERFPRSAMDIVRDLRPLQDVEQQQRRPRPVNKRVWASVEHGAAHVIGEAFAEAHRRDPKHKRRWIALVDGNADQIALIRANAKALGIEVTIVLDLIHVLDYLWKAAHCFAGVDSKEAADWVEQRLIGLLQGQSAGYLAKGMRRLADARGLDADARKPVEECATYLVNQRRWLHYDRALRDGLPIATGVIEGACRYLVRDRMDRSGARWSLAGAEAVLRLRALWTNGDFAAYWAFHLEQEHERTHRTRYAARRIPSPLAPSKPQLRRVK